MRLKVGGSSKVGGRKCIKHWRGATGEKRTRVVKAVSGLKRSSCLRLKVGGWRLEVKSQRLKVGRKVQGPRQEVHKTLEGSNKSCPPWRGVNGKEGSRVMKAIRG